MKCPKFKNVAELKQAAAEFNPHQTEIDAIAVFGRAVEIKTVVRFAFVDHQGCVWYAKTLQAIKEDFEAYLSGNNQHLFL